MTTNHTPGPWVTTPEQNGLEFGVDAGPWGICICAGAPGNGTAEANARLISAAPELLEACQTFSEWLRREESGFVKAGNERDTPEGEAAWREWYSENLRICDLAQKQAYSAIAKATGNN